MTVWNKDRLIKQWNSIQSREIDPLGCGPSDFITDTKEPLWGKDGLVVYGPGTN